MDVTAILVSVDHATGRGGIVIDVDGDVWLMASLEQDGGTHLRTYRPSEVGLEGDRTLVGGRLPERAASVEIVGDNGDRAAGQVGVGAWVIALDEPIQGPVRPVCFRNADGALLAVPLPSEWPRAPVTDSNEPCPACGRRVWDVITPADGSRGSRLHAGGWEPAPVIVCRACGHEEPMGTILSVESRGDDGPAIAEARIGEDDVAQRLLDQMTLSAVTFPIYAEQGEPGRLSASASSDGRVTSVTVAHGSEDHVHGRCLRIETTLGTRQRHSGMKALAEEALVGWLDGTRVGSAPGSDAAFVLATRADERARRQAVLRATMTDWSLEIDGAPLSFTCVRAGSRWAAVTRTDALTITITANGVEPETIDLCPVADPVTTLI